MTPTDTPVVTSLIAADDMRRAAALYRRVFGYQDPSHSVNPRLLISLAHNGGSVVGAHAGGELVAFAYGFAAVDDDLLYHYSQAAVVDSRYQGHGLGRALKQAQREVAIAHRQHRMRWSYDPALTRNAHFNLDVLGAVGRWFHADLYGPPGTDRIVVDWDLDDEQRDRHAPPAASAPAAARAGGPAGWFRRCPDGADVWVPVPEDLTAAAERLGRTTLDVRHELARVISELMADGYVAVSCQRLGGMLAAYRFVRETS